MMKRDDFLATGLIMSSDDKRIRDLGTYEMIWDCKFCGATALPARTHRFCPTCGAAQDTDTRRFPSDAEKRAIEDYVPKGEDRICGACGKPNDADATYCVQCGAPLENAARAQTVGDQVRGPGEQFGEGAQRDIAKEQMARDLGTQTPQMAAKKGFPWAMLAIGVVAILLCIGVIVALTWTRPTNVFVSGHSWQREIRIESFLPREDSAWCDQLPGDAYGVSSRREQRDTRRVPDGETCQVRRIDNGDGSFTEREECQTTYRDEPIYDDRCYYTINRWDYARSITTQGMSMAQMPSWGSVQLARSNLQGVGGEREAGRSEDYVLRLRGDGGAEYECPVDFETWGSASEESVWTLAVGAVTGAPDCATLQRAG
jgi:ribosomal protein L37E